MHTAYTIQEGEKLCDILNGDSTQEEVVKSDPTYSEITINLGEDMTHSTRVEYDEFFSEQHDRFGHSLETLGSSPDVHPLYIKTAPGEVKRRA